MNGLTLLIVAALAVLFVAGIYAVIRVLDREDDRDPFAQYGVTVHAVEGFADLGPMPAEIAHEEWWQQHAPQAPAAAPHPPAPAPPPAQDVPAPHGWPLSGQGTNPAAAVEQPPQATLPPPPDDHDAHQAATAVGAAIAATHARIAEQERARAAELDAEARAGSPWADDTGTFTAICAEVA